MYPTRARVLAAVLFATQSLAGVSVGLAHVSEGVAAPAAIEAEHGSACVLVHDPARCPVCQVTGVAALPEPYRAPLAGRAHGDRRLVAARPAPSTRRFLLAAPPRAPPPPLV